MIRNSLDLFHLLRNKLTHTNIVSYNTETIDSIFLIIRQYPDFLRYVDKNNKQISDLIKKDVIRYSVSSYNPPLWIVPKKSDLDSNKSNKSKSTKRWRLVLNYSILNKETIKDSYTLPNITEILD